MHDHNLDDLIIDNIEPKNSKTKSFLTIIALMIVVLIVAIILTKILLKTPHENRLAFEENTTDLIAPELKLKETPKLQKEKEEPSLSKIVEEKIKTPEIETKEPLVIEESTVVIKKEKIKPEIKVPEVPKAVEIEKELVLSNIQDQEIKAPEAKIKKPVVVQEPQLSQKEKEAKDAADIAYWKAVQERRKAEKIAKEILAVKKPTAVIKEKKTEEVVKPKKVKAPKAVVTSVKKPVKKPVAAKPVPKRATTHKYYVQVGAFRNKPSTRFISVIRNNGYRYTMTKPNASGIKRLLIGPFEDRESVDRALIRIQDRIHKRAFVVKR